eukprot:CAMPEP_0197060114 /NCGR_PEP_ID=MMETSP1384-20130603/124160_1 /TAXON_ID=29189 /ORGANISM="Ammonia sp." /LENGTH=182 /DNA_ID=CAMNT_0042495389 /DNA_START=71 /DNA_END=619 /DNA_ORIENTATION=-
MQSLLAFFVAVTWAVSSGFKLTTNCDNEGWVQLFQDGNGANDDNKEHNQIIHEMNWWNKGVYEVDDEAVDWENAILKFTCKDKGVVGGFIASVEWYGCKYFTEPGEGANTMKGPFRVVSNAERLKFTPYGQGAWGKPTGNSYPGSEGSRAPQWVWEANAQGGNVLFNEMVFEFRAADVEWCQ